MSDFFIYLFKVSCWIAIWWLIYLFFLRRETFYSFNRIYLMTGLAASFLFPLLTIYYPVEVFITHASTVSVAENIQAPVQSLDIYSVLFYLYIICGAYFIIRQLFLLLKIKSRIRSDGYTILNNCYLVNSPDIKIPFSFYKYIFLNFLQIPEKERQLILTHEHSHIKQHHWIDLAIAESIRIILWFNPFMWFYQRSIKENHEYLADEAVIRSGYSPACYHATLINQSLNIPVFQFVNSFAYYKFKRITMMKKENSNPFKKLAVLLLVPAASFLFWAFAEPEYRVTTVESPQQQSNVLLTADDLARVENINVFNVLDTPVVSGRDLQKTINRSLDEEVAVIGYGKMDTIIKESSIPTNGKIKVISYRNIDTLSIRNNLASSPLIIIDGKESTYATLEKLKADEIESISVLKDASANSVYGEKGKKGAMIVTTKRISNSPEVLVKEKDNSRIIVRIEGLFSDFPPLFIIDGEESTHAIFKELKPDEIESISILKDASAIEAYGEKGKKGVMIVITKKNNNFPKRQETDITG